MTTDGQPCNREIKVDCYEGFDGLTIRIDVCSKDDLTTIKNAFADLAEGKVEEVEFLDIQAVVSNGLKSLRLRLAPKDTFFKALQLVRDSPDGPEFLWSRSPEGWKDFVWLIDGMLKSDHAGHQYFDYDSLDDDALVVVAFREGGDGAK
jgi:hypothetical protein